jgi:hypothetical protein
MPGMSLERSKIYKPVKTEGKMVKKSSSREKKEHHIAVQNATLTRKTRKKPGESNECKVQRGCTLLQKVLYFADREVVTNAISR